MIALLDVGVLVALFDPAHVHHEAAHVWLSENRTAGWATCPVSENGFARVVAHPEYPGRRSTVMDALERLQAFTASGEHHFWPDSTSLRRSSRFRARALEGQHQITGAYLLLLAVENEGRLATLDGELSIATVPHAAPEQLAVIA
ncbi:MAG TPA: TA system VapC family ribonuclease toxin [Longimicrobiales bacterium]|nr:TA system VapC family ribonuclease toxin [Longimicrobiales bacterium]